jgi:thermitase
VEGKETRLSLSQHRAVTWALVLGLCLVILPGAAARAQANPPVKDFVSGQVVVELRSTANPPFAQPDKARMKRINADYGTSILESFPANSGVFLLELPAGAGEHETVSRMARDQRLLYAEPNFVVWPLEGEARHRAWGVSDAVPSPEENATSALNLSSAHDISLGEGATVAVLDTGVQLDHPALASNFQGVARYDFVDDDDDPSDSPIGADEDGDGLKDELAGHGTHVSGIVALVAPKAKIMPLRVLDTEGIGDSFTIAKAIYYATQNGADVINLSFGSQKRSKLLVRASGDAIEQGVLVAAAAGNSDSVAPEYPAAGDHVGGPSGGLMAVTSVSMWPRPARRSGAPFWAASTRIGVVPRWRRRLSRARRRSYTRSTARSTLRVWHRE